MDTRGRVLVIGGVFIAFGAVNFAVAMSMFGERGEKNRKSARGLLDGDRSRS